STSHVHCTDVLCLAVFFFQAEDGIRDFHVTGVQTCALPISSGSLTGRRKARRANVDNICRVHAASAAAGGHTSTLVRLGSFSGRAKNSSRSSFVLPSMVSR